MSGVISSIISWIRRDLVDARRGLYFPVGLECEGRGVNGSAASFL